MRSAPFQPVLGVAVCAALAAPAVGQTTWYVDDDTCPAPGSGTLNDPFCSVQAAIGAASDGDTIEVLPGTYVESINTQGKAITLRSTNPRDPAIVAATVLDGAGQDRVITVAAGERPDTVIEGLTIVNGDADVGGGIGIVSSSPTIRSCVFRDNSANQGGGAYLMVSSSLFDQCTFENNAAGDGGGAFVYATTWPRFDRCTFINNSAVSEGGGVGADFANVRLARCLLANNSAGAGGAYGGAFSDPYVVSSLVRDNTAGRGGAFYLYDDNSSSSAARSCATSRRPMAAEPSGASNRSR